MKHILEKLLDTYKSRSDCQAETFKVHRGMMNNMIDNESYSHIQRELIELEHMFKEQLSVEIVRPKILEILKRL